MFVACVCDLFCAIANTLIHYPKSKQERVRELDETHHWPYPKAKLTCCLHIVIRMIFCNSSGIWYVLACCHQNDLAQLSSHSWSNFACCPEWACAADRNLTAVMLSSEWTLAIEWEFAICLLSCCHHHELSQLIWNLLVACCQVVISVSSHNWSVIFYSLTCCHQHELL